MATKSILTDYDFGTSGIVTGMRAPTNPRDATNKAYVDAAIEGTSWKRSARVATQSNISLASPGATIDSIALAVNDRVLVRAQTDLTQNGIYVWNGAAVPMVRAADANSFDELEQAVLTVEEGSSANTTYRQTAVNGTIGADAIEFTVFGQSTPPASDTQAGIVERATQSEVDAGTDNERFVTPETLANYAGMLRKFSALIGDGSATSYAVSHNLGTRQVIVQVFQNGGSYDAVDCEAELTSTDVVTLKFNSAVSLDSLRVNVIG